MGSLDFSEAASRLAGLAGALFGWRPDEFWRSTPAELAAVLEAVPGGGGAGGAGASSDDLERLKRMFPDG